MPKLCRLDNVVSVVDSLRLVTEFGCGDNLVETDNLEEEDIENLIIQQIEFCNIIILNKTDEVTSEELARVKTAIRKLQPKAEIIEANYGIVPVEKILNTNLFNFEEAATSAGWLEELNKDVEETKEEEHDNHHEHRHEHHGHHHESETEEYGISSFVYYRRPPLNRKKFASFANNLPKNIIRCKGLLWFKDEPNMSYIFEQAGKQVTLSDGGEWFAVANKSELEEILANNPDIKKDWDEKYGDRMVKLVFIGRDMDKKQIIETLENCIEK